ncbi:MAG: hypothetical protein PWQ82_217 [Thermosediminibacterales bacterium]|nr:hypothetical protein [Thermosediminibacterales bacterium]MDK2835239.1 hypothetical protein [Thermosediminibacterales bacterium]
MIIGFQVVRSLEYVFFDMLFSHTGNMLQKFLGLFFLIAGSCFAAYGVKKTIRSIIANFLSINEEKLLEVIFDKQHLQKGPKIVAIGGGTGLSVLLRGLKEYTSNLTAIVTVTDDGGSSGILRGELGILPPGDIRNCLIALADTEPLMEKLFQYRFKTGSLKGHSFGNLFLAAMTEVSGDFQKSIKQFSKVLAVKGQVLPITLSQAVLFAVNKNGEIVKGESKIPEGGPIEKVFLEPDDCRPLPEVIEAIKNADAIILGPGSLYTSIIPNLLVKGVVEAISESPAVKIYVTNVMTQAGETKGYTASQHVKTLLKYGNYKLIDYVIVNTEDVPEELLEKYKEEGAEPVKPDIENIEALGVKVISDKIINKTNFVRHDSKHLARLIIKLLAQKSYEGDRLKLLDLYYLGERFKDSEHKKDMKF